MNTTALDAGPVNELESSSVPRWLINQMLDRWAEAVEQFRHWEDQEILRKEPSPQDLGRHRHEGAWIIRATRHLQDMAMDPDFPLRERAEEIAGRLAQLEATFMEIHDPMTDQQADEILRQAFPDAPGTGKPG
jgi:hypothetical protein